MVGLPTIASKTNQDTQMHAGCYLMVWVVGAEAEDGPQAPVVWPPDHASAENHEVSTVAERGVQVHGAG